MGEVVMEEVMGEEIMEEEMVVRVEEDDRSRAGFCSVLALLGL